jgi:hypothetical protein
MHGGTMSADINLLLAQASNEVVRSHFVDGFARFVDGKNHYCIADMKRFRFDVFRRTTDITFTATIQKLPLCMRAAINGQYFGGGVGIYAMSVAGGVDPARIPSVGNVVDDGVVVLNDEVGAQNYYFFGRNRDATAYRMEKGSPLPSQIYEGMGGLGPMIGPKEFTGERVHYGITDLYGPERIPGEKPTTAKLWAECVQRNSATFRSIQGATADGVAVPILASNSRDGLLLVLAKTRGSHGDLEYFRDTLWNLGYDRAAFGDGSTSTCLVIDGEVVVQPAAHKDGAIEAGFALCDMESQLVKLEVTIESIEVLKTVNWASEDLWSIRATLSGKTLGQTSKMKVEVGMVLLLNWTQIDTFGGASTDQVVLGLHIQDHGGISEVVTEYAVKYGPRSEPKWKIGRWTIEDSDGYSRLTFSIRESM